MESLRLTIPSQQEGQHILVETDQGRLRDWLRSLPLADMSKTLPEITRAISSLNRTELPYKQRAELVASFDISYRMIHDYFRPGKNKTIKNPELEKQTREKMQNLTREMAFAHKIVVNDSQNKRSLWGKNKVQANSLAFAIFYLGLMLIEQYEEYTPVPIFLWREINALYAFAGKESLEKLELAANKTYCLPTIEQNYIRNCLIALADPYHLSNNEHWHVFHYLQNCIHLARISEDPDDFRKDSCFIIDVTSENKPNFVTSELDDPDDPKIRLLLTFDLLRKMQYDFEQYDVNDKIPANSFHPSINHVSAESLWKHLNNHWRARIDRNSRRYPIVTKVDVVWGLNDVSRVIGRSMVNRKKPLTFEEIRVITDINSESELTWDAINVSAGGIGLCSRTYLIPKISLGDIALIREYMDGKPASHWRLAICRWHTGDKHNGTMLGLKYIEGKFSPVRLILHQGKNEKGGQPGIVVTDTIVDGSNSPTVITTRGSSQGDRVYAMVGMEQPVEIRPRVKVDVTPCVERFFFQSYELRDELAEEVQDEISDIIPWTSIPHQRGEVDDEFFKEADQKDTNMISLDDVRLPGDH